MRAAVIPGTTGEAGWGDIELRRRRNEEGGVRLVVVLPVVMPDSIAHIGVFGCVREFTSDATDAGLAV